MIIDDYRIKIQSPLYKITYFNDDSVFSTKISFFGYEIKKYSVIKLKK